MSKYVQFGAGLCGPEEWVNFDSSPTLRLQRLPLVGAAFNKVGPRFPSTVRYGDIVDGLPVDEASCRAVYSSHVLEHLSLKDFRKALRSTYRHLEPGGCFRFVLPDLKQLATTYVESEGPSAAPKFMKDSYLGIPQRKRGLSGMLRSVWGNSHHLWMWDLESMSAELRTAGFIDIREALFGDSADGMFEHVESRERWDGCLGVECFRPSQSIAAAA